MLGIKTSFNSWAVWHHFGGIFSPQCSNKRRSNHDQQTPECVDCTSPAIFSGAVQSKDEDVVQLSRVNYQQTGLWYPMKQTACHRDVSVVCCVIHAWKLQWIITKLWAAMLLAAGSSSGPLRLFWPLWRDVTFLQTAIPPCRKSL